MKKTSILTLLLCMIAALTMTSCLSDDDDDSGLSREEQHSAYLSVAGEHNGQLVYYDSIFTTKPAKVDSVDAMVNFETDSTVTVYNFRVNSEYNVIDNFLKVSTFYVRQETHKTPICVFIKVRVNPSLRLIWGLHPRASDFLVSRAIRL